MEQKHPRKKSRWFPPEDYASFFYASSDEAFKRKHPIGYVFLVLLGFVALVLPGR